MSAQPTLLGTVERYFILIVVLTTFRELHMD